MASQGSAVVSTEVRYLQVHTTTDSRAEAMELARGAVEARLAACAQVTGPIASTYWWEERVERAEEWQLILKLPTDRYAELAVYLTERHSYDEPEIVATPIITGSPGYLAWIEDETRRYADPGRNRRAAAGQRSCRCRGPVPGHACCLLIRMCIPSGRGMPRAARWSRPAPGPSSSAWPAWRSPSTLNSLRPNALAATRAPASAAS